MGGSTRRRDDESRTRRGGNQSQPGEPEDRIPSPRGNESAGASVTVAMNTGEEVIDGGEADDESSPDLRPDRMDQPQGAQYMPVTSIQERDLQEDTAQPSTSFAPGDGSPDTDGKICGFPRLKVYCFFYSWTCYSGTIVLSLFALAFYILSLRKLEPDLRSMITKPAILRPNVTSFNHPRAHDKLDVYFYNVTPVFDPIAGTMNLNTEELGPYRYVMKSSKVDVVWNDNSTVSYRVKRSYHFKPNQSIGEETDVINTINLEKLSAMNVRKSSCYLPLTDDMMRPQTVSQILWGRKGNGGLGILKNVNDLNLSYKFGKKGKRKSSQKKMNESVGPVYNVYTGNASISRLNDVYSYNGSRGQDMWPDGLYHEQKTGSADGEKFAPFVDQGRDLAMFYSQLKTNVLLIYQKTTSCHKKECYRYIIPEENFEWDVKFKPRTANATQVDAIMWEVESLNASTNVKRGNGLDPPYNGCESPFLVSMPHFIEGNGSQCRRSVDVHPISGITVRKRLCHQISLPVIYPGQDRHKKGLRIILPIMWVNWSYETTPDLKQINNIYVAIKVLSFGSKIVFCALVGFGSFFLLVNIMGIVMCCCFKKCCRSIIT